MVTTAPARNDHRQRVLRALGVTAYGLRGRFRAELGAACAMAGPTHCVLVLPEHGDARQRALLQRSMRALGPGFAHGQRITVVAGELTASPPPADAYLAFGEAQAQALARALPDATKKVLSLDSPVDLFSADGKRRLWQAVRALCRRWRDASEAAE